MKKLRILNEIRLGEQLEVIDETQTAELVLKAGQRYLIYQNEASEKTVIKFDREKLKMIRYLPEGTIQMEFSTGLPTWTRFPGLGQLQIKTDLYRPDLENNSIQIKYSLDKNENKIADYQLTLTYE